MQYPCFESESAKVDRFLSRFLDTTRTVTPCEGGDGSPV